MSYTAVLIFPGVTRLRIPPQFETSSNVTPDLSDIKTIAASVAFGKPSYAISLLGIDHIDANGNAYHLRLRPLFDPSTHNLRELWIDTRSYNIVRAVIDGEYRLSKDDVLQDTQVTEDFGDVGGYWLVIHKVWAYTRPFSGITYRFDFTSLSMQFPPSVPAWLFDARAFAAHAFIGNDPLFH